MEENPMNRAAVLVLLAAALAAPAAADEVIIGEMDSGCALPFCGG
jgi:hypothetical protein